MKKHLIVLSDLHINSTVALSLSEVSLDDGGIYHYSKSQRWLAANLSDFRKEIEKLDGEKILVLNGDIIDVNKHSQHQLITPNISIAIDHAYTLIKHYLSDIVDKLYIVRGTEAHVGKVAEYEDLVAKKLDSMPDEFGNSVHWSLLLDVNGVIFDIAHHGVVGQKAWTRTHPLDSLAANTIIESTKNGSVLPGVIIRSHLHTYADTYDNYPVRVIQTPAWQLATSFSYRIGAGLADIGGLIFSCEDGKYELIKKLYKPEGKKPTVV
ncbi:MAG: hypothetical protein HC874_26100 [Richelia sp. SL_2_1]|nr:hypothetical protein [Richelia sp. SL_2_1]